MLELPAGRIARRSWTLGRRSLGRERSGWPSRLVQVHAWTRNERQGWPKADHEAGPDTTAEARAPYACPLFAVDLSSGAACLQPWRCGCRHDGRRRQTYGTSGIVSHRREQLAGFADIRDHNSVFQSSCLELHCISRLQPFEHATVRDVEGHFHRLHPDASVRALHRLDQEGDRSPARAGLDSSNLPPRMNVPSWRNELIMFPIELFKPLAWRWCKGLTHCRTCKKREATSDHRSNDRYLVHDILPAFGLRAMRHGRDNAIGLGGVRAASHLRHDKPNQIDLGQESHKANRRRPSVDGLKHVSLSAILTGKAPPRGSSRGRTVAGRLTAYMLICALRCIGLTETLPTPLAVPSGSNS